jgi:thiol-disulfide isomerase/thioredoxin
VNRKPRVLMVLLLAIVVVSAGCMTNGDDDDGGPNGNRPPPTGTTEGFTFPDIVLTTTEGSKLRMTDVGSDFIIVHVVGSTNDVYEPQIPQIRTVLDHFDNVTVEAITVSSGNDTGQQMATMADALGVTWPTALPDTDIVRDLSLVKPLTVFLLDADLLILVRSDEALGQARMVQAIEATWGVEPPDDVHPEVGSKVPDMVWRDIDGIDGTLSSLEGSPVLLNVWEMECPFCMELFVELEKVAADHAPRGLKMVSIDLITWETEDQVRAVRDQYNASWTFAIDGDNIQSRYDIWRLPLLVLLDAEGVVQWTWTGYTHSSVIDGEVEKLI